MFPRQPRPPRMAAGLRQPAPGQLAKQPQGENVIPGTTSRSPSARKTEVGQNRGLIRGWGATDSHSSIIRHALLWTEPSPWRGQHRDPRAGSTSQRPPGLQVCDHSFRIWFQNRPESKTHQTVKLPGQQGPGAGSGEDHVETPHSIHVCMLTPHMPPLHPILYIQMHVCTPYTPSTTLTKYDACTHSTHPQIHTTHMNMLTPPTPAKYTHHTRTNVTHVHTHSRPHTPH